MRYRDNFVPIVETMRRFLIYLRCRIKSFLIQIKAQSTAEYALMILAAVIIAGILISISQPKIREFVTNIFDKVLSSAR